MLPLLVFRSPSRLSFLGARTSLRTSLVRLDRFYHQPAHAILLCQCFTLTGGTGISTSCPSPTTFVLGLGPDLPWVDEPSPGNLGLSTCKFLACISLLIPAFSLLHRPRSLPIPLLPVHDAPLPLAVIYTAYKVSRFRFSHLVEHSFLFLIGRVPLMSSCSSFLPVGAVNDSEPEASVVCFSPGHLRRTITRPVSYYALFECVAASKPTSWLSVQLHILSHLTHTSGP